jgi:hypothetical protein
MILYIFIVWFALSLVIGVAAKNRGRFGFGWFLLSIFFSPLVAGLALLLLPDWYMRSLLEEPSRSSTVDDRALERAIRRGRGLTT